MELNEELVALVTQKVLETLRAGEAAPAAPRKSVPPAGQSAGAGQGTLFDSFLSSKQFQELLHATVLDTLRSPEGQELIARVVRKELLRQR